LAYGFLMGTSFIIHYLGWQLRDGFLRHLSEKPVIQQVDNFWIARNRAP
jgi:hypothetical protein